MKHDLRLIVCGGRDYYDRSFAFAALDMIHAERRISCIIEGGATGADRLGREWAISRNVPYETYAAKWDDLDAPGAVVKTRYDGKKYNAMAGFNRNGDMLKAKPDGVVAFPGGRGTADMVKRSEDVKVPVWQPATQSRTS